MNFSRLKLRPLTIILTVLATLAVSECFMARRNILAFKRDWTIAQEGFINPGLNAIPSYIYRRLLTGYSLKSDHLMGVQRLFSRDDILPEKLEAEFTLGGEGYVDLLFNGNKNSYTGIRLSSNVNFPSMVYEADHSGKYLRSSKLNLLLPSGKTVAAISDEKIIVNGKEYGAPRELFHHGKTGVQVAFKDTELNGFVARGKKGTQRLDFYPDGNRTSLYLQTFIIVLTFTLLSGFFWRVQNLTLPSLILGAGLLGLGWQYVEAPEDEGLDHTLREFRILDSYWTPEATTLQEKVDAMREGRYFPGPYLCRQDGCFSFPEQEIPEKKGKRILLFGGSQFKHSLVKTLDDSFHFRFDRAIRKRFPDVETININSTGLFRERLAKYKDLLPTLNPDEIILESLSFDTEVDGIISFIREWTAKGVKVFFLRRPVNVLMLSEKDSATFVPEIMKGFSSAYGNDGWHVPEVIRVMPKYREAQKEIGYVFLDPNAYLLQESVRSSGELFWDGFHFTAWGQKLWAEWLAGEYLKSSELKVKRKRIGRDRSAVINHQHP